MEIKQLTYAHRLHTPLLMTQIYADFSKSSKYHRFSISTNCFNKLLAFGKMALKVTNLKSIPQFFYSFILSFNLLKPLEAECYAEYFELLKKVIHSFDPIDFPFVYAYKYPEIEPELTWVSANFLNL